MNAIYRTTSRRLSRTSRRHLKVEVLENRLVLAGFTVHDLGDSHDANPGDGLAADGNGIVTLRAAIEESNALPGADAINFSVAGTILLSLGMQLSIAGDLQVDAGNAIVLDGGGTNRVISVDDGDGVLNSSTVTLRNLAVSNGFATSGGGILNRELTTLEGVTVRNNRVAEPNPTSAAFGGGIFNEGSMRIANSVIRDNTAADPAGPEARAFGGGIANYLATASLTVENSLISHNVSSNSGGGIFSRQGAVTITNNSTISDNTTGTTDRTGYGGGLAIFSSGTGLVAPISLIIDSSTITGNRSVIDSELGVSTFPSGGGLYVGGYGSVEIRDSVISSNSATGLSSGSLPFARGGGAHFSGVTSNNTPNTLDVQVSHTDFRSNYSGPYGAAGAFFVEGRNHATVNAQLDDSILEANTASHGGAFATVSRDLSQVHLANLTVRRSTVTANTARFAGASVTWPGGQTTFEQSTLDGNSASDSGGGALGVYGFSLTQGRVLPSVTIRNSTLSNNQGLGNFGGGAVQAYNADLTIDQSTISGNHAQQWGGGVYLGTDLDYAGTVNGGSSNITRSTITQNSSGAGGGGVALNYYHEATISNSIISGNTDVAGLGPDIYGNPNLAAGLSYNLIGNNTGTDLAAANPDPNGNIVGDPGNPVSAMLGPLVDNGGPTKTHLPASVAAGNPADSPAINTADPLQGQGLDQRAFGPRDVGGRMDIGSVEVGATGINGDFNHDGLWDCADIDSLTAAIAAMSGDLSFDMNGDGVLTAADITDPADGWLAVGGAQNPGATGGNPFLPGDGNLSGDVDGSDFGIWNANKFTTIAAWCSADFNADGAVDGSDFGIWNTKKFQSSDSLRGSIVHESVISPGGPWRRAESTVGTALRRGGARFLDSNGVQRAWPATTNQRGAATPVVVASAVQTTLARRDTSPPESNSDSQPGMIQPLTTMEGTTGRQTSRIGTRQLQGERPARDADAAKMQLDSWRDDFFAQRSVFSKRGFRQ